MKQNRVIPIFITIILLLTKISTNLVFADTTPSIKMELDKTVASVGDIIKADLKVEDITTFSGYQVNIKYDPEMLELVSPMPEAGDILNNENYGIQTASDDEEKGILNISKNYLYLEDYREDGNPEETGVFGT
ncbi:cohesin domain-containing protein, partial [Herbivorax sp. ANBcel31]|uniref:cohesin domain-containing protein n=1 Tax=Herbivorax sp. ANBcel31 TaxID=3069754 RepID=UPI0027B7D6ED